MRHDQAFAQRLEAIFGRGIAREFECDVLDLLLDALLSDRGCFCRLDEYSDLVCVAQRGLLDDGSRLQYSSDTSSGMWSDVLAGKHAHLLRQPHKILDEAPVAQRGLAVPIVFGGDALGLMYVTGKLEDYDAEDQRLATSIAHGTAPYLFARNAQQRHRRQLAELEGMANAAAEGERFFMLSGDLMAITDERIVRVNPAFWKELGWLDHELRDKSLADLAHPDDQSALALDLSLMREEPNRERPPIVVRMQAKHGQYHSIEWTGTATEDGRVYAVGRDVSELHSAVARLASQNDELRVLHDRVKHEQRLAGQLLSNVRRQGNIDVPGIRHVTTPLDFFNGDIVLVSPTPEGELRWLLGDFTGHGLSAAIGTIPIASSFYATSKKCVPFKESIETINDVLKALLPAGLFCAAAFLSLDRDNRELTVWNGGLPDVIVRTGRDGSLRTLHSQSLPLGLVKSRELDVTPARVSVADSDEVFVYSDGLSEAESPDGELFGVKRIQEVLATAPNPGEGFDLLLSALGAFRGRVRQADDVSLVVVRVGAVRLPSTMQRA